MTGPEYREIGRVEERLDSLRDHVADVEASLSDARARVERLEQQLAKRPPLPHVVLGLGEVLVVTGPADMTPDEYLELIASVEAMNLGGRVVVASDALRATIEHDRVPLSDGRTVGG